MLMLLLNFYNFLCFISKEICCNLLFNLILFYLISLLYWYNIVILSRLFIRTMTHVILILMNQKNKITAILTWCVFFLFNLWTQGLATVCRGTTNDKIHFIFNMYDVSHDNTGESADIKTDREIYHFNNDRNIIYGVSILIIHLSL